MARYGKAMIDDPARPVTADAVELALREQLARDAAMAASVAPILRYLLDSEDSSVFSDQVVARVRGMLGDVARQLLDRCVAADGAVEPCEHDAETILALTAAMILNPAFLGHIHALALEWQLTERLQMRLGLDPVLPPLLQALVASPEAATAELAMQVLAAQARFGQAQRRMRLPLGELPGDLLHVALVGMRTVMGTEPDIDAQAAAAEAAIRNGFDESRSRLGMISRLVTGMGRGALAALSIGHAGVAIFLTALALGSDQDRDLVALSTSEAQLARLAVALRAAGVKLAAIEEQLLTIDPDSTPCQGIDRLTPDRAAVLLALAAGHPGG